MAKSRWMGLLVMACAMSALAQGAAIPDDIKRSIRQRVDQGYNVGIIVGIVDPRQAQYYSYGKTSLPDGPPPDENTIFEIGSVTKVFTALVLADMAEQGAVALEDPIGKYLPEKVTAPTRNGRSISLVHLATHTSALPRLPDNMPSVGLDNPYARYGPRQLHDFLLTHSLPRDIGTEYLYSNCGMGLLGHLLARQSGLTYEQLVRRRITEKLGMSDTAITITPHMQNRFARGHRLAAEVANWDFQALAGAGALRSTARDMLIFLAANMGLRESPLSTAMQATHRPRIAGAGQNLQIGLAWHIIVDEDRRIHWHNGGTGGFSSFVGMDEAAQTGIVVLTNSLQSVDDIGFHFLLPDFPLGSYASPAQPGKVVEIALLPGEKLPEGRDIVERSIAQTGGRETLAGIHNSLTTATLRMSMFGVDMSGSVLAYQARPDKYYVKTEIGGVYTVEQGSNGDVVWEINSMTGPRVLTGRERASMLLSQNFDMTNYEELYQRITCVGKSQIAGRLCYKVILTPKLGSAPVVRYFAIDSGVALKTDYTIEQEKDKIDVESWAGDFRRIDGVVYPHHVQEKVMGVISHTYVQSIEHNVQITPGRFDPPEPIRNILDMKPGGDAQHQ